MSYDVNFLYVVSLYARNNTLQKDAWKEKVRGIFRKEIQEILKQKYDFYAIAAHPDVDAKTYIKEHFQEMLGKIYSPYVDEGVFSLALDNDKAFKEDNEKLLAELKKHFYVKNIAIGENPTQKLEEAKVEYDEMLDILYGEGKDLIKDNPYVLVGYCKNEEHLKWILEKGLYNTRTGTQNGSLHLSENLLKVKYLLLHRMGKSASFIKLKNAPRIMTGLDLSRNQYPYETTHERLEKVNNLYVVFELDIENTEKIFESYSWDIKNLDLKKGHLQSEPQYISLTELMKKRNK